MRVILRGGWASAPTPRGGVWNLQTTAAGLTFGRLRLGRPYHVIAYDLEAGDSQMQDFLACETGLSFITSHSKCRTFWFVRRS